MPFLFLWMVVFLPSLTGYAIVALDDIIYRALNVLGATEVPSTFEFFKTL